ncbi:hypothetical protein F4774DRAFT_215437 [Daldinia eschscholtzii]|nr:hypothetical protein F4774DRAFT_215437 [Daldinia eschscholtzii]
MAFKSRRQHDAINPEGTNSKRGGETASSSDQVFSYVEHESCRGWAGNYPCVFGPSEGCFRHNPRGLRIAYKEISPTDRKTWNFTLRRPGSPRRDILQHDMTQNDDLVWSSLPVEHSTVDPLDYIHPSIRYTLAYYHIHWVQAAPSIETQRARTEALACHGNSQKLEYWTYPCWHKDSFYLLQAIRFTIAPKKWLSKLGYDFGIPELSPNDWTFRTCPHYRQRFQAYEFRETRGDLKAGMAYVTKRRDPSGLYEKKSTKWQSVYGPRDDTFNCQFCCTDSYMDIDLVNGEIEVHIWVWKNLGKALNPFDPKWIAALHADSPVMKRSLAEVNSNQVRRAFRAAVRED